VYFPHRTFVSDVSEIPILFPFLELPFLILFSIKNIKTVMVLVLPTVFISTRPLATRPALVLSCRAPSQRLTLSVATVACFVMD
jgi:hypothetical protein